jgi:hypothetical protein
MFILGYLFVGVVLAVPMILLARRFNRPFIFLRARSYPRRILLLTSS